MTVLRFPAVKEKTLHGWHASELQCFVGACSRSVSNGEATGWEIGATELGEPQFYVIGPPPDHDCVLMVSRLGRLYVLEDGRGCVMFEHDNPAMMAEHMYAALRRRKLAITARLVAAWCAVREIFEEKIEPIMAEPLDLINHYGPQVAALV
jgi:hypothetical protein